MLLEFLAPTLLKGGYLCVAVAIGARGARNGNMLVRGTSLTVRNVYNCIGVC